MLVIDTSSPTPPYEQVRAQVVAQVDGGDLAPGARLPTVRRLAGDLGLAPNTVARAYRELERTGVVETRGRHGTFIARGVDEVVDAATAAATDYAERTRELGVDPTEALRLVTRALGVVAPPS